MALLKEVCQAWGGGLRKISKRVGLRCRPSEIRWDGTNAASLCAGHAGQATLEYILLLVIIISGALILIRALERTGAVATLATPIQEHYAKAYQYGHPKAKADEGSFEMHPRMGNYQSEDDVVQSRIFIYLGQR
jgi:hypothetical protein